MEDRLKYYGVMKGEGFVIYGDLENAYIYILNNKKDEAILELEAKIAEQEKKLKLYDAFFDAGREILDIRDINGL